MVHFVWKKSPVTHKIPLFNVNAHRIGSRKSGLAKPADDHVCDTDLL